jgi:hypothetical protein
VLFAPGDIQPGALLRGVADALKFMIGALACACQEMNVLCRMNVELILQRKGRPE